MCYSKEVRRKDLAKPDPEKYCAYCGKRLERKRFKSGLEDLSAFRRRKYCGVECMRKAYIKTSNPSGNYSSAHGSARGIEYTILGKKKVCDICGSTKNVDVHHKDGNYLNNSPDNLMLVCRSCHQKIHNKRGTCTICGRPVKGHGLCNMHYIRFRKYGNPYYRYGRIEI